METMPTAGDTPATSRAGSMTTPPMPTAPINIAPMQHAKMTRTTSPPAITETEVSIAAARSSTRERVARLTASTRRLSAISSPSKRHPSSTTCGLNNLCDI